MVDSSTSTSANPPRTAPSTDVRAPSEAGQIIGQYVLEGKLGEGGMGSVYRAVHINLKKPFAIKLLAPGHQPSAALIERFYKEMEAIGRLDHPNLVSATDAGDHHGKYYIVMEFVEGQDLAKILNLRKTLSVAEACAVGVQAAEGLQHLAERDLVHRDIKPSNLLLTPSGQVKILDLGLALLRRDPQLPTDDDELTQPGQVMGTWDYIAPEQSKDSHRVDIRADIYSLGCTLYKLIAGRAPFGGDTFPSSKEKVRAHQEIPIPPIRTLRADVPEPVERVLGKMLAKRPDDRYQQPREIVAALAEFATSSDLSGMLKPGLPGPRTGNASSATDRLSAALRGDERTRRIGRWIVAAVALAGVALAAAVFVPRPEPQPRFGHWRNVLDKEPVKLHWSKNLPRPIWRPERWAVLLDPTLDLGIVGLGVIPPELNYRYRVTIRQPHWTGKAGIVFGFQDAEVDGAPGVKFQSIGLEKNAKGEMWMQRTHTARITKGAGMTQLSAKQWAPRPLHDDATLEIEVHGNHLLHVRWAGEDLTDLCARKINDQFAQQDYAGAVGVWAHNNTAEFRDAQVMYLER